MVYPASTPQRPQPRKKVLARDGLLAVLGLLGLTVSMLACGALVRVGAFAWARSREQAWSAPETINLLPQYGRLPPFSLRTSQGERFDSQQLHGYAYLLQFLSEPADAGTRLEPLLRLQRQLATEGQHLQVILVMPRAVNALGGQGGERLPCGWQWLWDGAELEGFARTLSERFLPAGVPGKDGAWSSRLLLVDPLGGVRGFYALGHDVQVSGQLLDDARCLSTCGPLLMPDGLAGGGAGQDADCDGRPPPEIP